MASDIHVQDQSTEYFPIPINSNFSTVSSNSMFWWQIDETNDVVLIA